MTLTEMWRWGCLCVVGSGLGYPGDGLSCGLGYPTGDGIISLIGKIGLSGGERRLVMVTTWGIHVNLLEHE